LIKEKGSAGLYKSLIYILKEFIKGECSFQKQLDETKNDGFTPQKPIFITYWSVYEFI